MVVDFRPHNKRKVLEWLVMYMLDDGWQLTASNLAAKRGDDYRWRVSKKQTSKKVWFASPEDVNFFQMVWKIPTKED
jgi:hypothetical protein